MVDLWQISKPRTRHLGGRNIVLTTHYGFSRGRSFISTGISSFKRQKSQMSSRSTGHATKHGVVEMLLCRVTLMSSGETTG